MLNKKNNKETKKLLIHANLITHSHLGAFIRVIRTFTSFPFVWHFDLEAYLKKSSWRHSLFKLHILTVKPLLAWLHNGCVRNLLEARPGRLMKGQFHLTFWAQKKKERIKSSWPENLKGTPGKRRAKTNLGFNRGKNIPWPTPIKSDLDKTFTYYTISSQSL